MTASLPPLQEGATAELARFASQLAFEDLPDAVVDRVKLCVLDGLGVCLHGSTLPWTRHVGAMVSAEGGHPVATLFGTGRKTSYSQAVLVNATAGHAFEMDDIHTESVLHTNSLTTPIAIGAAEAGPELSGKDLITAIVAGCEVGTRIGNAATTRLFLNGFHPQGTTGTFVASATSGRLLGLDPDKMLHALGTGGSMAAGLMAAQEGAMVKRLHSGRAAQSGVYAAQLAQLGFTGITDIAEAGYGGFLSSFAREPNVSRLTAGLGRTWETLQIGFKLYPNVTSIHTALDALRHIMHVNDLKADDIANVSVGCGHMTYVHTAWTYRDAGITAAQMNMFYGLAAMATGGQVSVRDYTPERLRSQELLQFIPRIEVHEDPELEAMGPRFRHACRMTVETRAGLRIHHEILNRRGSPDGEISEQAVREKFFQNVSDLLPDPDAERIAMLVGEIEERAAVREIVKHLARAQFVAQGR